MLGFDALASLPLATGVPTRGSLNVAQAANTVAATGRVLVSGSASVTQAADSVAATGAVLIVGSLAKTQGADSLAATGNTVVYPGQLDAVQGADTLVSTAATSLSDAPCVIRSVASVHSLRADYVIENDLSISAVPDYIQLSVSVDMSADADVSINSITPSVSYVRLVASTAYTTIKATTCWDVVADREAA